MNSDTREDRPHWEVDDLMTATDGELIDVWNGKPFERFAFEDWNAVLDHHRGRLITDAQEMFDELPDPFTIWRGSLTEERAIYGFAWTTSEEVGRKFAQFFNPPPPAGGSYMAPIPTGGYLARTKVTKNDVSIFTNARQEFECVLRPLVFMTMGALAEVEKLDEHPHAVEFFGAKLNSVRDRWRAQFEQEMD